MNSSAIKRLINASGVAIIYGTIFKFSHPTHSLPQSSYLNAQQQQRIRDLESFKMNLVLEANEMIENLNHVLSQELHSLHEKYSFDGSISKPASSPTTNDLEQWVKKYTKHSLPNFSMELTSDERIKSKLRVISPTDLQKLYQPHLPTSVLPSPSVSQSVDAVVDQFYRLEYEVITRFSDQQHQVNDTIKSFQSKIFAEKEFGSFLAVFSVLTQLLGCQAFLSFTNKFFETATRTESLIHPIRPFSKPITLLLMAPLGAMIYYASMIDESSSAKSRPRHLSSPSPHPGPPPPGPDIRVVMPSPSVKHLPQNIYHFSLPPPIHEPCTDRTDPWKPWSVFVNILLPPMVEGYVFRKLLLNTLLSSTSPLKANFLVAVAATACHAGVSSEVSSIYEIKHSLSGAYDVNHPPEEVHRTLSIPVHPLMLQLVQYISGSVFVSTTAHLTVLFFRQLALHNRVEDVLFSPVHSAYYDQIAKLHSSLYTSFFVSLIKVVEWSGKSKAILEGIEVPLLKDLFIRNLGIINKTTESSSPASASAVSATAAAVKALSPSELEALTVSTEDLLDLYMMLRCQMTNQMQKRKPVMPPKFREIQKKRLPTPPFSHRKESGYFYEHFLPNSKIGHLSFQLDSCRLNVERMAVNGKMDILRAMILSGMYVPPDLLQRNADLSQMRQFKRDVFYWDERATEEELLDLVHELNAHVLEKILRSVDIFRVTRGAWMCMELQGQEVLDKEEERVMLERYLLDLDSYISVLKEREWLAYAQTYGLSPHRLQSLVERRGREHPELLELWQSWERYFQSEELREKIHNNGNPFRVYRPRSLEE